MTDKRQSDALHLADIADDGAWTFVIGVRKEIAAELRRQHIELETLRTGYAAARLEIESLRADLRPDPGSYPVPQPAGEYPALPKPGHRGPEGTGSYFDSFTADQMRAYVDADRAMRAAQPAGARQSGAAYAELPEPDSYLFQHEDTGLTQYVDSQQVDWGFEKNNPRWKRCNGAFSDSQMRAFADATCALRPPHGQAPAQAAPLKTEHWNPLEGGNAETALQMACVIAHRDAQAAPAYKDSTPELHVGDSAFESWYNSYSPAHKSDKQRARDAYAAGMGDPLVSAAPAAVAGPSLYQVMAVAKAIHATTPDADDWDSLRQCEVDALRGRAEKVLAALAAAPTTQPARTAEVVECGNLYAKVKLHGDAFGSTNVGDVFYSTPQPAPQPTAQSGVEDTALLNWLNENIFYREMGEWDAKYGHGDGYNMWVLFSPKGVQGSARTIISAARAAQEGK